MVAAAAQLPRVAEGPSENALAALRNGSVLCVMRVEGQSGHHSPYRSAISDDGGESWHSLRALPDAWARCGHGFYLSAARSCFPVAAQGPSRATAYMARIRGGHHRRCPRRVVRTPKARYASREQLMR